MKRLYAWLLRLYPRHFRERFGQDMAELFSDRWRHERRKGPAAAAMFAGRSVADVMHGAAAERDLFSGFDGGIRMSHIFSDLRAALLMVIRRPVFSLSTAAMLAVGLGFNIALFAVVNAVVLKPLPYADGDRVMMLWTGRNPDGTGGVNSYADYTAWKERATSFTELTAYNISLGTLTGAGDPEEIGGSTVSPEFFRVLGGRMALGRPIERGDELVPLDQARPIVISHSLWQRTFHGDPAIVGRRMVLNNNERLIVGVMDERFIQPEPFWGVTAEYWTPLSVSQNSRNIRFLRVLGRLKPGISVDRASGEMDAIGKQLISTLPTTHQASVVVSPVRTELMGDTRWALWLFLAAVSLVLLLAAGNIVNLLLARASGRRREFVVRAALGASRSRLAFQLIAESTMLGVIGGVMGLALARGGIALLVRYGSNGAPGLDETTLSPLVLLFTACLSIVTGALCGAVPAIGISRMSVSSANTAAGRAAGGFDASRRRLWLVAGESALAVPLLVGAALLTQTLVRVQAVDPGFNTKGVLKFRVSLNGARYNADDKRRAFFDELRRQLQGLPGVTDVGMVSSLPLGGLNNTASTLTYTKTTGERVSDTFGNRIVDGKYFDTLGVPVLRGRAIGEGDTGVVVVNDAAAKAMWGDAEPIGQQVRFGLADSTDKDLKWMTVVGVVGSLRHESLTRAASPEIFQPYRDNSWADMMIALHTSGDPSALMSGARGIVRGLDSQIAVVAMAPIAQLIDRQLAAPRFGVLCSVVFGFLGLAMAAFGTFAVLSLLVAQRTKEIGVRMALGASRSRVARMVLAQSLLPVIGGCTIGGIAASLGSRFLSSQLFGVAPNDPATFAGAIGVLAASAFLASWLPTRRATRVDPVTALRSE